MMRESLYTLISVFSIKINYQFYNPFYACNYALIPIAFAATAAYVILSGNIEQNLLLSFHSFINKTGFAVQFIHKIFYNLNLKYNYNNNKDIVWWLQNGSHHEMHSY